LGTLLLRAERAQQRRFAYGGVSEFIEAYIGKGAAIGHLLTPQTYLLYGTHLDRRAVPIAPTRDHAAWLDALRASGVTVLAVGPLRRDAHDEAFVAWLTGPGGSATLLFLRDDGRPPALYRVQ